MKPNPIPQPYQPDTGSALVTHMLERSATIVLDDFGATIDARLRLMGLDHGVRVLLEGTPRDERVDVLERGLGVGLATLASAAELTAENDAHTKLIEVVTRVGDAAARLDQRAAAQEKTLLRVIEELRRTAAEGRKEEQQLRTELSRNAGELGKAAKALDLSRAEIEHRTLAAYSQLLDGQAKAKEKVLSEATAVVKQLMDPDNPVSAPSLVKGVVDRSSTHMEQATKQNLAGLRAKVEALLGEGSPFADRIARLAREGAERDLRQVRELLDSLRSEIVVSKTRQEHDPTVKGRSYEDSVAALVGPAAGVYGFTVQQTGAEAGREAGNKKGDLVLFDEACTSFAAIEARDRRHVSARKVLQALADTARNRDVKIVAYFAASPDCLPAGLSEFTRGRLPLTYKRLPNNVHAVIAIIDVEHHSVGERIALVMWLIDRLLRSVEKAATSGDLTGRIQQALPRLDQVVTQLGTFRVIKGGLTKATGQLTQTRQEVEGLEEDLKAGLAGLDDLLRN